MSHKKGLPLLSVTILVGLMIGSIFFGASPVYAADGSGTNVVSPTNADIATAGNTFTFTFTATETMDSGGMEIAIPSGWSAPTTTAGIAGYTSATSATGGMIANVVDNMDSLTNWQKGACGGILASTATLHEGSASIECANITQGVGKVWYKKLTSAVNWSPYTRIGFWIYSSLAIQGGDFDFAFSPLNTLGSPQLIRITTAIPANTWTYINLSLGTTTRSNILSYGFRQAIADKAINHADIFSDDLLAGPGLIAIMGGNTIAARILQLANGGTITVSYGDGGGINGVTAPSTIGVYTATTTSRISDSGMLTAIATQPTLTARYPLPILTSINPPSIAAGGNGFVLVANGANFVNGITINLNGTPLATAFVNASQATASITASQIATGRTYVVTVTNPAPGGGVSAAKMLTVNNPIPTIATITPGSTLTNTSPTLVIDGTNFNASTTVTFNGANKPVTIASSTQLSVTLTMADTATAGTSTIMVANPAPGGGIAIATNFTVIGRATKLVITGSPYTGTVEAPLAITIQAQKTDNSIDANFNATVTLALQSTTTYATTSDNIVSITNGVGTFLLIDHVAETVSLSLLDAASTSLDVTSTGTVAFAAGAVTRFTLSHVGDLPQFTRKQFTIGRLDRFDNAVSATSTTLHLYGSPTTTSAFFFDTATGSSTVTSAVMAPGSTSTDIWYGNNLLGTYTITASDNATAPDGAAGIFDASNTITVTPVATNLQIIDPGNGTTDGPLTVRVEAHDDTGALVTGYTGSATLIASSSNGTVTIANSGMLTFAGGIATTTVTDRRPEWVALSLTGTTLTATSTRIVSFAVGQFAKLDISGPTGMTAGMLVPFTMTRTDMNDNPITSGGMTITLAATPTTTPGMFFVANATSSGTIGATALVNGQASTTVYYFNTAAGSYQLTFTGNAVSNSASIEVLPAMIAKLSLTGVSSTTNPGGRLQISVSRKDQFDNLISTGDTTAYLYATPTASSTTFYDVASGGSPITSISITPGASTKNVWYYETMTGSYTITASDNATAPDGAAGMFDASLPVTVHTANATRFVLDAPNPQTMVAGSSTLVTVRATDAFGNVDIGYQNGITLVTGVSSVTAPGLTNGNVLITLVNGVGTLTLTDTIAETVNMALSDTQGTGLNASSTASAQWIPGPTAKYILTDLSPEQTFIVASSTRQYRVTRRDRFNNAITTGTDLVYLYSTSNGAMFKPTQASTTSIPFVAIAGSATSSFFWYADTAIGAWDITISNNQTGPNGLDGFIIGTSHIDVVEAPIVATKYSIITPTGVQAGQTATVVIRAVDENGFTQNNYTDFINVLVSTSSANVPGLVNNQVQVHMINGIGTISITDPIAETIHFRLSIPQTSTSTLNASSTADLVFSAIVIPPQMPTTNVGTGGGAGTFGMTQTSASLTGKAFPGAQVILFAKTSAGDIPVKRTLAVAADGTFTIDFTGILNGLQAFGLTIIDPKTNTAQTKIYGLNPVTGFAGVTNISAAPTATFVRKTVTLGNNVGLNGYGIPGSVIGAKVDGVPVAVTAKVQKDGTYRLLINTYGMAYGPHILQAQQIEPDGTASDFTTQGIFTVTKTLIVGADLNNNGKIDIGDMSIFLANFNSSDPAIRILDDLNGDGKVDLTDLSIFLRIMNALQ